MKSRKGNKKNKNPLGKSWNLRTTSARSCCNGRNILLNTCWSSTSHWLLPFSQLGANQRGSRPFIMKRDQAGLPGLRSPKRQALQSHSQNLFFLWYLKYLKFLGGIKRILNEIYKKKSFFFSSKLIMLEIWIKQISQISNIIAKVGDFEIGEWVFWRHLFFSFASVDVRVDRVYPSFFIKFGVFKMNLPTLFRNLLLGGVIIVAWLLGW